MGRSLAFRASLGLAILCLASALARAQQEFGSQGPPPTHFTWRSSPPDGTSIDVTYYVSPTIAADASLLAGITAAANTWSSAGAFVNLSYGGATLAPPAGAIYIDDTSAGPGITGSTTVATVAGGADLGDGHPWRRITDALISVNVNASWYYGADGNAPSGQFDFYAYMLQQFGFALGLGPATTDLASVMTQSFGSFPDGSVNASLSAGDVAALSHLYGSPEPATWMLFGIGLATLAAARRIFRPGA